MTPSISVVLTTHNRAALLPQAIETVLAQSFTDFELIIVDDGSIDDTASAVEQIANKDARIVPVRHEQARGLSAARNTGISKARGRAVTFLDDDDLWFEKKIEKQFQVVMNGGSNLGLVYCWFEYFSSSTGRVTETRKPSLRGNVFAQTIERQPLGNGSTFCIPVDVFRKVSGFDETLRRGIDGDFVRRLARTYKVDFVPEVLARLRVDHGHGRITNDERHGIVNALAGHYRKLEVFPDLEIEYPRETAGLYSTISGHHMVLGQWGNAAKAFSKAVKLAPFSPKPFGALTKMTLARLKRVFG